MSGYRSLEIVVAVVFLLALLLPVTLGNQISAPRSAWDFFNGFSRFNLSASKLTFGPAVGIALTMVVFTDPTVPTLLSVGVLVAVVLLEVAALTLGARRSATLRSQPKAPLEDDGLDYASRMRRLEDQIANRSVPRPRGGNEQAGGGGHRQ